eukprot:752575-Hanusia_phi.AAC.2
MLCTEVSHSTFYDIFYLSSLKRTFQSLSSFRRSGSASYLKTYKVSKRSRDPVCLDEDPDSLQDMRSAQRTTDIGRVTLVLVASSSTVGPLNELTARPAAAPMSAGHEYHLHLYIPT